MAVPKESSGQPCKKMDRFTVRWRKDWDVPVVVDAKLYEILLEFLITKVDTAC